jgi:hypothetical protein
MDKALDEPSELYYSRSVALAGGDVAAATAAWNASTLRFMVETLRVAREARPRGKWAYFGIVQCTFDATTEKCGPQFQALNDRLTPLWRAGDLLYPELYATCPFVERNGTLACDPKTKLEKKIRARLGEAKRTADAVAAAGGPQLPLMAFTWAALDNGTCPFTHCPPMQDAQDLHTEFELARGAGAAGLVVWGSGADVTIPGFSCADFGRYLNTTLGPVLRAAQG